MRSLEIGRFIVIGGLIASCGWAAAQATGNTPLANGSYGQASSTAPLGHPGMDEFYVENALRYTNVGVVFSRLAVQKASDSSVRAFAKDAADKHIAIGAGLMQSAKSIGVKVPAGFPPKYETEFHALGKLSGLEFDRHYLEVLVLLQHDDFGLMLSEYSPGASKRDDFRDQAEKDANTLSRLTDQAVKLQKKIGKS